ncbi:hypothetical protein QuyetLC_02210 [Bacillus anthracis]|uniref:Uncharacterized protein n=1 Tax=Bacillus anthracis TaxID=1392 RepID=A0A640NCS4_BACAN|nr:hypothetical protein QuyetLC_02210 [Bacillus anthracis]
MVRKSKTAGKTIIMDAPPAKREVVKYATIRDLYRCQSVNVRAK